MIYVNGKKKPKQKQKSLWSVQPVLVVRVFTLFFSTLLLPPCSSLRNNSKKYPYITPTSHVAK